MAGGSDPTDLLAPFQLTEYEERALSTLIEVGRTTAPSLSEATGIPKARIYGVLDELGNRGYIEIVPGRPKEYAPKPPSELLNRAVENERQAFESFRQSIDGQREVFLETFQPLYERGASERTPTEELFHVVDVGEPSERETRRIYHEANEHVDVLTKSFEYFEAVEPAIDDALDRGVEVRVLLLDPELLEPRNRDIQASIVDRLSEHFPGIEHRFSASRLPWRGTIADPSMEYDTGEAIVLVEEEDIPLHKRQAAVTANGSFVAGLGRYFELTWEHDTVSRCR